MTRARGSSSRDARRAITLVEVILSTLVVGVMLAGALGTVAASQRDAKAQADKQLAQQIANDLLAEIMGQAYSDASDTATVNGPTATESATGNRTLFNDVNDYKVWTQSPPTDRSGVAIPGTTGWTRSSIVEFLTPTNLGTISATDQGIARITVSVKMRGGTLATAVGVRTSGLPATQACKLGNSTCAELTPTRCTALGGTPQGVGTTCWTIRDAATVTLIAQWKFEDLLPVTALDSAGLHVATLLNGPTFISHPGGWGNALKLDGINDHGTVLHAADLSLNNKITLCAWIYSENFVANAYQYVLNKGTTVGGPQNYYLAVFGSRLIAGFNNGSYQDVTETTTTFVKRTWYHVAATIDGSTGTVRLFVNGVPTTTGTVPTTIPTNTEMLYLGRSEWTNDYFNGRLDDVRIYDGIVTDADILKIYGGSL